MDSSNSVQIQTKVVYNIFMLIPIGKERKSQLEKLIGFSTHAGR